MTRRTWLAASVAAGAVSVFIAVSGGIAASVGGVRVSARSWTASAVVALVCAGAWAWLARRDHGWLADLRAGSEWLEARGPRLVTAVALLSSATAVGFATFSASGADASGYLSQAAMWSRLTARVPDPLVSLPGWPLSPSDTAPLGWRPALDVGWQVPTYAPGLPWLMAVPHAVSGTAGGVGVVAASAGVAVWATGALAFRLGGGVAALLAAALLASSPSLQYHAFQPMSDVPVTAAWMLCWWLVAEHRPAGAGLAAAVAVLIRPNLAPLAAVPWLVTMARGRGAAAGVAAPVALAGGVIAALQWHWYGSPFTSGYGSARELFSTANLLPNLRLYGAWLWQAEWVIVLATAAGVVGWKRMAGTARTGTLVPGLATFAAGVTMAYLVYAVFEVWTYVRFLLPALAIATALAGVGVAQMIGRLPRASTGPIAMVVLLALVTAGVFTARSLGVYQIAAANARAREAGVQLARVLPPRAVLLSGEQSGSMRYATGRPVVRWEALDAASLGATLAVLRSQGLEPWWVLDQFEEALVRARFAGVPEAQLDWPPRVEAGPLMRTRAWRVADRVPVE